MNSILLAAKTVLPWIVITMMIISTPVFSGTLEEEFVRQNADKGLAILRDQSLSNTERAEQFGLFIDQTVDGKRVARFVLGKYARGLDKTVLAEFQEAFTRYAKSIYQDNLSKYGGETIIVTGSVDRKPGDSIVETTISGGALDKPLNVRWRVRTKNGISKIIDLEAFGIWLAVQQRSEITAYIANNGGTVSAATLMLQERIAD